MSRSLTVFRSRLRPQFEAEYEEWAERMRELAASMPGFISIDHFTAEDGERLSLVLFESAAEARAWKGHPEHRIAQRLGRERFYSEYTIEACTVDRVSRFEAGQSPGTVE